MKTTSIKLKAIQRTAGFIALIAIIGFFAVTCDNGSTHTHSHSTAWSSNATQHWHECDCGDKADVANHTFVGDTCSVCGYERDHVHSHSATWEYNDTQHWNECDCGDKANVANHTFNGGECTVCDYKEIEAKYRFTNEKWRNSDFAPNGTVTVGVNYIATTDRSPNDFNFTGVYTTGGGIIDGNPDDTWTYLYDGTGKIGIAMFWGHFNDGGEINLGASFVEYDIGWLDGQFDDKPLSEIVAGMQDDINGYSYME